MPSEESEENYLPAHNHQPGLVLINTKRTNLTFCKAKFNVTASC